MAVITVLRNRERSMLSGGKGEGIPVRLAKPTGDDGGCRDV